MINNAIDKLSRKENLSAAEMSSVMEEIMQGAALDNDIYSFLLLLEKKGVVVEELFAAALTLRKFALTIKLDEKIILDTCGTGGDKKGSFNISTVSALVTSGAGVIVAKHGNRSVSSRSGSADILEALGVNINLDALKAKNCLKKAGIAFLFAPNFHPSVKYAMPARKKIGSRTIFNLLGPLSNPASATHQLVGVFEASKARLVAEVLSKLGSQHALVVCGKDGLDEITTTTETLVVEQRNEVIDEYEVRPEDYGIKRAAEADLLGGCPKENAGILLDILNGNLGPKRDIVVLNSAFALFAADQAKTIAECIELAKESIDSGRALRKLQLLREYSN